ncbi:MAG: TlpA disulfide reductase family protein [Opitutaceae bacterium]|nr:TlpA disulfide reductase family protein [Opitutaceae bacterium]
MSTRLLFASCLCLLVCGSTVLAQAPKGGAKGGDKGGEKKAAAPKTPADLAYDEFNKARTDPGPKDQARFQKVIAAGVAYLVKYPTHGRAGDAVRDLAFYGNNNTDAKQPALRTSYLSNLRLAVTNERFKEGVSDPTGAALQAVEAAAADAELRAGPTPALLAALREKLDEIATVPGIGRFLTERERSYTHLLTVLNQPPFAKVEEHLKRMLKHADKGVAGMAQTELNIIEARKAPYDLKFTALDGKEFDLAQLRGKVVALYFWSTTNRTSVSNLDNLQRVSSDYKRKGLEMVTVCFDKEEDRAKVLAAIKEKGIKWPVHFDGKGAKNDFAPKLNITGVPALLIFDQKGMLQASMQGTNLTINLPANQIENPVKRLLEPAKK